MTANTRTIATALPPVADDAGSARRLAMRRIALTLRLWRQRRRERRKMHELLRLAMVDPRMLADIGLSRNAAEFLANKPFWRE